jgi:hypothetical protein
VRHPDRPERSVLSEPASLRERIDALPANHPSSPGFTVDATSAEVNHRQEAGRDLERHGGGSVDQRARAFKPAELAIAEALADRGAVVVALVEDSSVRQPQPDAMVDGRVTEFKSLSRGATDAAVKNQLRAAYRQAPNVVIDARGSGLEEDSAALGLRRFRSSRRRWVPLSRPARTPSRSRRLLLARPRCSSTTIIHSRTTRALLCRDTGTGSASGTRPGMKDASWLSRGRSLTPLDRRAGRRCSRTGSRAASPSIHEEPRNLSALR